MPPTTAPPIVPPETLGLELELGLGSSGVGAVVLSVFATTDVVDTRAAVTKGCDVRAVVDVTSGAVRTAMLLTTRALADGLATLSEEKVAFMRDSLTFRNTSSAVSQHTFI